MFGKWMNVDSFDRGFNNSSIVSVREWTATMLMMMLPIVNIVMLVWWAYADKTVTPASKVNWARGTLIVLIVSLLAVGCVAGLFYVLYWFNDVLLPHAIKG